MGSLINQIYIGHVLDVLKQIPKESVDCIITSPPYWGLRDYGTEPQIWDDGWRGSLGLEPTPELFVQHIVQIFREARRVLKEEGTLWLNLGDSYSGSGCGTNNYRTELSRSINKSDKMFTKTPPQQKKLNGLKPKDLVGIPWRVAFALQADGWYLRSDIIWHKPNPMPESVTDRPTKSHEYVFLLAKSQKYYFDQDAVREPLLQSSIDRIQQPTFDEQKGGLKDYGHGTNTNRSARKALCNLKEKFIAQGSNGRNIRSVWTIATQPYKEAHFATFPEKLIEPMIKAGTSGKGCCPKCGKAWVRVVEKNKVPRNELPKDDPRYRPNRYKNNKYANELREKYECGMYSETKTLGWKPACECGLEPVPCVILDPFIGSGTTAKVAIRLRRNWIGIELKPEYADMANKRKALAQIEML